MPFIYTQLEMLNVFFLSIRSFCLFAFGFLAVCICVFLCVGIHVLGGAWGSQKHWIWSRLAFMSCLTWVP